MTMSSMEPYRHHSVSRRLGTSAVVFVVAAVALYSTVWLALGILRHIVMPIIAVVIAGYLAAAVFRRSGRKPEPPPLT